MAYFVFSALNEYKAVIVLPEGRDSNAKMNPCTNVLPEVLPAGQVLVPAIINNLMVLHVHKNRTDTFDLTSIAKEFIALKETRVQLFGQF